MSNITKLLVGELKRLLKYKIFTVGIFVALIWVLIIALTNKEDIEPLLSILIGIDASLMSILFLGAAYYFEKQEGTIKTMLVAPVNVIEVLIAKILAATIMSLVSAYLISISALIFHGIKINLFLLLIYTVVIVISHAAIGYTICLQAKDFGSMIGYFGVFILISFIPILLLLLNIIPQKYEMLFLILPLKATDVLYNSLVNSVDLIYILISLAYLIILGSSLYISLVYKKFKKYAAQG